jgi:pyruvate/2-oxoglutarate dehydrogenase complex dihydrolipoamide acyltransferase (E2) component
MYAMIELDVTDLRQRLRSQRKEGKNVSFFSYLLRAIARTIDENKDLNIIRSGKQIYCFDEVDIDIPIELKEDGVSIPRKYEIRDAANKTAEDISLEIVNAKKSWKELGIAGEEDKWAQRWIKVASVIPEWLFKYITKYYSKKPFELKKRFGTTYVTSVSGFSDVSGFVIPFIAGKTRPLAFTIGSIVKKPGIVGSEIRIREYLSLTISINHDLVDGAPAARFVNRLKQRIEGNNQ